MKIYNLPDDVLLNRSELASPIVLHRYKASVSSLREKSVLKRNAVSLVIRGQKTIQFPEKAVETNDREIHFLSSGNSISSFDISRGQEFESILIFFDDNEFIDFSVGNSDLIDEARREYSPASSRYVSIAKDDFIRNYIASILLMVQGGKVVSLEMKRLKLWELLLYLLENYAEKFVSFLCRGKAVENELAIRKVVEANVTSNLTLEEMSFLCNVSLSTFKRQFTKIYKSSPADWFLEQKMKIASDLLRSQKERPGEIWFKLGFETHTGFTRSFKKRFGISPKDYRLTCQE